MLAYMIDLLHVMDVRDSNDTAAVSYSLTLDASYYAARSLRPQHHRPCLCVYVVSLCVYLFVLSVYDLSYK